MVVASDLVDLVVSFGSSLGSFQVFSTSDLRKKKELRSGFTSPDEVSHRRPFS